VCRIEWVTKNIMALQQPIRLAHPLRAALAIVTGHAQAGEQVESREGIAASRHGRTMIHHGRRFNPADLQARLAKWMLGQLEPAQTLPSSARVRPL
jgi:hypothetical protein